MTAEERRKKHQLELKEQLHEEAKVFYWILFAIDIFSIKFWCGFGGGKSSPDSAGQVGLSNPFLTGKLSKRVV